MRKQSEVIINGRTLEEILVLHSRWTEGKEGGIQANLSETDLSGVDLRWVNLSGANLTDVNLAYANLGEANLTRTDLRFSNLMGVNLRRADLRDADLSYAILTVAKLSNANLLDIKYNDKTASYSLQCPEKGAFIGYKRAYNKIVELLITEDALRSSATSRKCRCSKAKVLTITDLEGIEHYNMVKSDWDRNFIYKVGETVEVEDFDTNRWRECTNGIHFFITRDEAVRYR